MAFFDTMTLTAILQQLEGPYKWYVIGGVIAFITILITRYVFKTIKWLLLFVAIIVIASAAFIFFFPPAA